jgi:hypothetical protein
LLWYLLPLPWLYLPGLKSEKRLFAFRNTPRISSVSCFEADYPSCGFAVGPSSPPTFHIQSTNPALRGGFDMRFMVKILLLSVSFAASLAYAQTNNIPQVQHVIVVIQENRTPDNLFGSDAFAQTRQLPGADLVQLGKCGNVEIQLQSLNLGNACDPNHAHNGGWIPTYDSGSMDGACISPPPTAPASNPNTRTLNRQT